MSTSACACTASGQPRSCIDCLNVRVQYRETCYINPVGLCVGISSVITTRPDFDAAYTARIERNVTINGVPYSNEFFSSANTTYCSSQDAVCQDCTQRWVTEFGTSKFESTTNFSCVGADGCVCTAYCWARASSASTLSPYANIGGKSCYVVESSGKGSQGLVARNITMFVVFAVTLIAIVKFAVAQIHRRNRARRVLENERRNAIRRQRGGETVHFGLMLSLDGWNSYRAHLIDREQALLGADHAVPVTLTDAATARVVVEEGEGFRPDSPSQLAQQRSALGT